MSDYVFMTAAHVLVDENTGVPHTSIQIAPRNRLPSGVSPISISDYQIDPNYTAYTASDPNQNIYKLAYDIGFIRMNTAMKPTDTTTPYTIKPHQINSTIDQGLNGRFGCPVGNSQYDPLFIAGATSAPMSWFNGTFPTLSQDGLQGCSSTVIRALTYTLGYPVSVNGQTNSNHYAYLDKTAKFFGYGTQTAGQLYVLEHPDIQNTSPAQSCANCKPVEGLTSWITKGDSGGPVFGITTNGTITWTLLGVMGNSVNSATAPSMAFAAIDDYWNDTWIQDQIAWKPQTGATPNVIISSPTEGATYDLNVLPDLKAVAGTQTSKIQWASNIDGALGTGGDVPVSGKLSPGAQVITATLPATTTTAVMNGKATTASTPTVVTTLHITVTGIAKPNISASPVQVVVPYGSPSGETTITWTLATGSAGTSVAYSKNGGAIVVWKTKVPAGSAPFIINPGDSVVLYAYQYQYDYTKGNKVTVTGVAGAQPTMSAMPNPVPVSTTLGSANYTLTWNAPGYGQVTLYAQQNIQNPGKILCVGSSTESGSAQEPMATGEVATLWLLSYTACTPGSIVTALPQAALATVHLSAVTATPPSLTATPNPVIVPFGQTSTLYTLSWSAQGYGQVTLYGQQNLQNSGQIVCLGSDAESGNAQEPMSPNESATLWLLPYTGCTAGTVVTALPEAALASVNITGIAASAPTLAASPNPVIISTGQTTANYTLSWGAQGYLYVTLYGRQNLQNQGQIVCLGNGASSGSTQEPMTIGETATLWLSSWQNCTPGTIVSIVPGSVLATTNVTAVTQSPSTLTASPNPVSIPTGQTSANYTLTWNAPGFSQVTLYGVQNIQNPGRIVCLGSGPGAGSALEPMSSNEAATLWLLPYTGCTPGSNVSAVPLGVLATLKVSASN